MIKQLYTSLKANIKTYLKDVKTVALFNNQFENSLGENKEGTKQKAFDYPAVFLEFNDFEYRNLSMGVQEFDFNLIVHFGWKTLKTEDDSMLNQLENLYWVIQRFQQGSFSRLSRVSQVTDTNHENVIITKITYKGRGQDFNRYVYNDDVLGTITGTTISLSATTGVTDYNVLSQLYSGATVDNGNNMFTGSTIIYCQ